MLLIEQSIERGKGNNRDKEDALCTENVEKDDCSNNIISRKWIGFKFNHLLKVANSFGTYGPLTHLPQKPCIH
jgi:hypothetical protein